jgi:hypothetical protein
MTSLSMSTYEIIRAEYGTPKVSQFFFTAWRERERGGNIYI